MCFFAYRHIKESKQDAQGAGAAAHGRAGDVAGYPAHRSLVGRLLRRIRHAWHSWSDRVPREGHVRFQNDEASIAGFGFQADPSGDASLPVLAFFSCFHTNTNIHVNTSTLVILIPVVCSYSYSYECGVLLFIRMPICSGNERAAATIVQRRPLSALHARWGCSAFRVRTESAGAALQLRCAAHNSVLSFQHLQHSHTCCPLSSCQRSYRYEVSIFCFLSKLCTLHLYIL